MPWPCKFHKSQQFVGSKQSLHHIQVKYDIVLEFIQKNTLPQNSKKKKKKFFWDKLLYCRVIHVPLEAPAVFWEEITMDNSGFKWQYAYISKSI